VLEINKFAEQMRLERERQKELEEEEMIRQLRKELVPKAQPMPYFDRPFVPKRQVVFLVLITLSTRFLFPL
jgi:hypothetical protein